MSLAVNERVPIELDAPDPISRAGLAAQLRGRPEVRVVERADGDAATVAVILADEVDEVTLRAIKVWRLAKMRVVLVVGRLDDAGLVASVDAGVCALMRRQQATAESIVDAAMAAARGAGVMPPDMLGRLLEQFSRLQRDVLAPRGIGFSGLNEREVSVLRLVADGHDGAEVARRLCYSERTVKAIIHDITTRLNLRNRTHAVAYALRQGLI
ncbi:MAG: helix-turn-helix transcriptional regulator [Acidimicrobiales bacterium]